MKDKIILLCICMMAIACFACEDTVAKQLPDDLVYAPEEEPIPPVDPDPENPKVDELTKKNNITVWIEGNANFERLSSPEKMDAILEKVKAMGATGIIVEVKGMTGLVQYKSNIADRLLNNGSATHPESMDYLGEMVKAAKNNDLYIYVAMSIMTEGANGLGLVYSDPDFMKMQSQLIQVDNEEGTDFSVQKMVDMPKTSYAVFMNPSYDEVYEYEASLLKEVAENYDVDGILLDYCRFYEIASDFSDYSLERFRQWMGTDKAIQPSDIVKAWNRDPERNNVATSIKEFGTYTKQWLEWRSSLIRNVVGKLRADVKNVKPDIAFGTYCGAWYDSYYTVGVNWASEVYDVSRDFSWATPTYKETGYAEQLDIFYTGNYTSNVDGSGWWAVKGQLQGADKILKGSGANLAVRYYGAIDMGNTQWKDMNNMTHSISTILDHTGGIMLFDLVHIDAPQYNQFNKQLYDDLKSVIDTYKTNK